MPRNTITAQLLTRNNSLVGYCDVELSEPTRDNLPRIPEVITPKTAPERTFIHVATSGEMPVYREARFSWVDDLRLSEVRK